MWNPKAANRSWVSLAQKAMKSACKKDEVGLTACLSLLELYKIAWTRWLVNNRDVFLHPGDWKSKVSVPSWFGADEAVFPITGCQLFTQSQKVEGSRTSLGLLLEHESHS